MLAQKIEHNLHYTILFLSGVFAVIALWLHVSFELVELMFVLIVTFGMIGASIYDSYQAEKRNETEFKHFKTFCKGKLFVKNIGTQLDFTTNLFVVEHPNRNHKLRNEIITAFEKDHDESNLRCHEFTWRVTHEKSEDNEKNKAETSLSKNENQKNVDWTAFENSNIVRLRDKLNESQVVVVVLSYDFKNHADWVYCEVDNWAKNNPDKPVLFIKPDDFDEKDIDGIPKLYYWIEEDAATIPWRLLKRSNKRTTGWENQSQYNRMFWKYAVTLIGVLIGLGVVQHHGLADVQKNYFSYRATVLKKEFAKEIAKQNTSEKSPTEPTPLFSAPALPKNESNTNQNSSPTSSPVTTKSLEIRNLDEEYMESSIWRDDGFLLFGKRLFQEGSSDKLSNFSRFGLDSKTIVGCAFLYPNHFVEWNDVENKAVVIDRNNNATDKACTKFERPEDTMRWISCFVFQRGSSAREMIGICMKNDPRVKVNNLKSTAFNFAPHRSWLSTSAQNLFEEISKESGIIQ